MTYIQRKKGRDVETVDHFDTLSEAKAELPEHRMSDPEAEYYLSSRPCKGYWN